MKLRMEKTLKFWVDCSYEDKKHENANHARVELIAEILRDYERSGHAMRKVKLPGKLLPACFRYSLTSSERPKTIWRIGPDASGDGVENQPRDACIA